ncbi:MULTISPECIES: nucleotidyltransferase domain-containing protein [Pseudomonas]|uniref:Polymerase beta nucleotidyltransferase domain-containing protein n=1 Tax=Pseudomonas gessardii TaxID=78544 RepID=A0ABS9FB36_9PSED|nr:MULTISPECIES: nucleotidyltransferase domain-containing protein [Pseudomonas]MCF5098994.1 hypothetical protein [Pseudomonas gessardii]MCF5109554.1 hypothetical protein [Pseudomonas gessardii]
MEIDDMAAAIASWASTQPLIRKVYLFGSRVRGTHMPSSDLDVAVEVCTLQGDSGAFTTWTGEAHRLKALIVGVVPVNIDLEWYGGEADTPRIHAGLQESSIVCVGSETGGNRVVA